MAIWIIATVAVCGRVALTKSSRQDLFPVYQNAGQAWLNGQDLYRNSKLNYRYSPLFAAAMTSMARLPLKLASISWRLLSVLCFLAALGWVCRVGVPDKFALEKSPLIFLLILPLSLGNLNNGQANLLVLATLLAALAAVMRDWWMAAAIVLTVAVTIKLYPLVIALLLVVMFPRKLLWRFALCLIVAVALPFVLQKIDYVTRQYNDWFLYLRTEDRSSRSLSEAYNDLRLLFRVWFFPLSKTTYVIIQLAAGAAIALLAVVGKIRHWPRQRLIAWIFSLSCCWMTLLGPATESATYVLIAPATAWIVCELLVRGGGAIETAWVAGIYALQLLAGMASWFGGMKRFGVYASPLALSVLLLAAYLLRPAIFRQMKERSRPVAAGRD
jgi:Glycosyltransferase family 87